MRAAHAVAELIAKRANVSEPNMGLTTWENAPGRKNIEVRRHRLVRSRFHEKITVGEFVNHSTKMDGVGPEFQALKVNGPRGVRITGLIA